MNFRSSLKADVATKLRCLGLCKVEMSLGGLAGSVSRRRGDHHIGAAPAQRGDFDVDLAASAIRRARFFRSPDVWFERRGPFGMVLRRGWRSCCSLIQARISPEALVLDNGGMTDALQLVESRVRQRPAFPANLQPPIRKVIDLDHFAAKANCQAFRLERQLHATVVHHQLVRHLTLLTPAQNLIEILPGIDER